MNNLSHVMCSVTGTVYFLLSVYYYSHLFSFFFLAVLVVFFFRRKGMLCMVASVLGCTLASLPCVYKEE